MSINKPSCRQCMNLTSLLGTDVSQNGSCSGRAADFHSDSLCYAKTPSRGFQPNLTLLHSDRLASFIFLQVADFKGVRAG
jgi:hypothetical protein